MLVHITENNIKKHEEWAFKKIIEIKVDMMFRAARNRWDDLEMRMLERRTINELVDAIESREKWNAAENICNALDR